MIAATESIQNRARKDKQPDFAQWQQILNHHKREITKEQWFRPVCTDLPYSQCFTKEAAKQSKCKIADVDTCDHISILFGINAPQ